MEELPSLGRTTFYMEQEMHIDFYGYRTTIFLVQCLNVCFQHKVVENFLVNYLIMPRNLQFTYGYMKKYATTHTCKKKKKGGGGINVNGYSLLTIEL